MQEHERRTRVVVERVQACVESAEDGRGNHASRPVLGEVRGSFLSLLLPLLGE